MAEPTLTLQQQAVVENRGGTLLVSAAAGSGKTKVLVDRVIREIRQEGKNINEFLIITFTNAAAAELRGKISKALGKALAAEPQNQHLRRQLTLMHLAQISTVHAFCGALIRQYGYLLEVPSDYTMLEDPRREEMLTRLIGDLLEEAYGEMQPGFRLLADTLGAGRTDQSLETLIRSVFERMLTQPNPEAWLSGLCLTLPEQGEPKDTVYGAALLDNARQHLTWMIGRYTWAISQMQGDQKLSKKFLPAYESEKKKLEQLLSALDGPWDAIRDCLSMEFPRLVVQKHPDPQRLTAIQQVRNDLKKKLLPELTRQFSRPAAQLIGEQNVLAPALRTLCDLARELNRRFSAEKRRKNVLDFSDQEHLAIRLLVDGSGRPTPVAQEVSQRYAEIMVDEYQDSNRVQELIYRAIVRGQDENRFLVGDVKQSIYGFRQAEPELFLEKYQTYRPASDAQAGECRKLILSKNFRSRPEILEAVNHTFSCVMSREVGGMTYGPDESLYPGLDTYPQDHENHVELDVLLLPKGKSGSDSDDLTKYQKEAAWVAQRITQLLEQGIPVRDGDGTRPVRPEDIAILLRTRDPIRIYQRALVRAGIPVAAGAGENLFEAPEVQMLLSLLRALDNPHQDVPLLAVLCSPLYRLSNDQLGQIRAGSRQERFYDAMCECEEDWCRQVLSSFQSLREKASGMSAEQLVWYLLEDTGLLAAYSAMEQGQRRRENLLSVYALARTTAGGNYLYLYELIRALNRMEQSGQESASGGASGVTLTTIHRSKGLEYPVVFLSDLSRKFNFRELNNTVLLDGAMGVGAKIVDPAQRIRYPGMVYEAMSVKKRQALLDEELRILYVGMTRPKDYLFMTYAIGAESDVFSRLRAGAGMPAEPWCTSSVGCLGDWVLLAALPRVEAGDLFSLCGRPDSSLKVTDYPWRIQLDSLELVPQPHYGGKPVTQQTAVEQHVPAPEQLVRAMTWENPHAAASRTPSKLTATELKGRNKDLEAQEDAAVPVSVPKLLRPEFILEKKGLTPTEQGTAAHQFLQYARFSQLASRDGILSELDRMVDSAYLTEQQAEAVKPDEIARLFSSPLGQRLLSASKLIREFKFSLLTPADRFYSGLKDEQVLLQGVVDAAILEPDSITVIDFKTDRISAQQASVRAEHYRPQLETYREALGRIFERPVREMILYFLKPGKEVTL